MGKNLTAEEFERVLAGTIERRVEAGAFVCMKGEPVDYWMGVVDGLVKMSSDWVTGKTTTFTGLAAGGWFGEGSLLKNDPRKYDVVALRDSRIAYMNRATYLWLMDHSIPFNRFLITQLNERLGQFIGMMENERLLDTDARLARNLAAMFQPGVTQAPVPNFRFRRKRSASSPTSPAARQSGAEDAAGCEPAAPRVRQGDHPRRRRAALLRRIEKPAQIQKTRSKRAPTTRTGFAAASPPGWRMYCQSGWMANAGDNSTRQVASKACSAFAARSSDRRYFSAS